MGTGWDLIGLVLSEYTPTFLQFTFGSTYAGYYQPQGVYTLREGDAFTMVVRASTCTGVVHFNAGPVPLKCRATPRGMVAMGDSYSSGEGREPYDTGTAGGGDTCHRNATAWPRVLAASDPSIGTLTHIACSGATAAAITGSFKHESAQIKQLKAVRPTPDVVTISLGGNDVGFASLLKQCYLADCWRLGGITKAQNLIKNTLPGVLASVYAKVRAAAPGASVYAVGYPRIFPVLQDETTHCGWLTSTERIKVNLLGDLLNTTEAATAQQAGVTYVPTLDALAGHELCTLNSWMAPVTSRVPTHQEEGHPTPRGHEAMEQLVRKAID
jgi:lysophospholipase L1-like esterase